MQHWHSPITGANLCDNYLFIFFGLLSSCDDNVNTTKRYVELLINSDNDTKSDVNIDLHQWMANLKKYEKKIIGSSWDFATPETQLFLWLSK